MEDLKTSIRLVLSKNTPEIILISVALVVTILSILIFLLNQQNFTDEKILLEPVKSNKIIRDSIFVDLSGAVERPDVYETTSGARLKDVLVQAGGLSVEADRQFFARNFNLARKVNDQEKIYIPTNDEVQTGEIEFKQQVLSGTDSESNNSLGKISINTSTLEQLDALPGIGPITAQKIIQSRPYQALSELTEKKVIGKSPFEKIKDLISL